MKREKEKYLNEYKELILKATDNLKDGTDAILALLLDDAGYNRTFIDALIQMNIKGKMITTLYNNCCYHNLECLKDTITMFYIACLDDHEVMENLESDDPIPFIDKKYLGKNSMEDLGAAMSDFYYRFENKAKKENKKR